MMETQWNKALDNLIGLAKSRKQSGHSPWDDPGAIEKLRNEALHEIESNHAAEPDYVKARLLAFFLYDKLVLLFAMQSDKLAKEGRVSDSVGAYALLMLRFEEFFLATIAFPEATIAHILKLMDKEEDALSETYANYSKQIDDMQDAISNTATAFSELLNGMRQQHDALVNIKYHTKM